MLVIELDEFKFPKPGVCDVNVVELAPMIIIGDVLDRFVLEVLADKLNVPACVVVAIVELKDIATLELDTPNLVEGNDAIVLVDEKFEIGVRDERKALRVVWDKLLF